MLLVLIYLSSLHTELALYAPARSLKYARIIAYEKAQCVPVRLENEVKPLKGNNREFSSVFLGIGATVSYRVVDHNCRHVVDSPEVIRAVFVGYVLLAPEHIEDWSMDILEFILVRHRHTRHGS